MFVNLLTIGLVIWFTGVSVKDFACLLVDQYQIVGAAKSRIFDQTLQVYLFRVSLLAILLAGIFYYYLVKKLLLPLQRLGVSTKKMAQGEYSPLPIPSQDEIGELTADFNHLSSKLKQVENLRQKMVSDIAHELRTPLSNINGYLEALSSGVIRGNQELYRSLHEESLRMSGLVEQLHQLNVWESKKLFKQQMAIDMKKISIDSLIETTIKGFDLEFQDKKINCEVDVQAAHVIGARDGLKQVLTNLISNAIHYDQGGWVIIEGKKDGQFYKILITNQGQPIPDDQADEIFERFYRLDPSRQRATGGSGLGLAIAKEIVEHHGGQVGLISKGNKHSFWFTVPLAASIDE